MAPSLRPRRTAAAELGVTWVFECGENSRWNDRYTFTPTAVEDKILRFDWTAGDKTGTIETPVASLYTGFKTKKVIGDRTTKQVIEWGDLSFDDIEVGERTEAWVRQSDSRHGRNRWHWTAEVTAQISIDTEAMGTLDVFVIERRLYCEEWRYRAENVIYYSPDLNGPVYWKVSDSNGDTEECRDGIRQAVGRSLDAWWQFFDGMAAAFCWNQTSSRQSPVGWAD